MIATLDRLRLGYDEAGRGNDLAVLFLHGFPHDRTLWSSQLAALGSHVRCIAPDLRGFGESSVSPPYSMDQYADDVAAFMDSLGLNDAVICGLSMGGYIALAMWRRHKKRIRALILADTKATADNDEARDKRRTMAQLARDRGSAAVADALISGMVGKHTRETAPHIVDTVYRMLAKATVAGVVGALEALRERPDSTATLPTIDVLTLLVVGEDDVLTPVADAQAMHRAIYGSRLEVLAHAGHVSNMERPAAFNHVVSEFLATVKHA
ncbi:MAG TPA: alpha/beta fold hydrolase [Gemmatimonadaceae bacterium]|nr:alpha/beta fold hydrolase [Gemmatimonadaceae bacterium]